MKRSRVLVSVGLASVAAFGPSAAAAIVGYGGQLTYLATPPASCMEGDLTGFKAFAWNEQRNVPLALTADMINNPAHFADAISGWIEGRYDSHFLHFQGPPGSVFGTGGALQFDAPIAAVMFTPIGLDATDALAGLTGTCCCRHQAEQARAHQRPDAQIRVLGDSCDAHLHSQCADLLGVAASAGVNDLFHHKRHAVRVRRPRPSELH